MRQRPTSFCYENDVAGDPLWGAWGWPEGQESIRSK